MPEHQLPERRIDLPVKRLQRRYNLPEIDGPILEELAKRPATTGFIADNVDEQAGYVSQRLAHLTDVGIVLQLRRGYYEIDARMVASENGVSNE